jgi:hypothetical protein
MPNAKSTLIQKLLHGTDRIFENFASHSKPNKYSNKAGGVFMTDNPGVASTFALENRGGSEVISPYELSTDLQERIAYDLGINVEDIKSLDVQDWAKNHAAENSGTLYYYDQDGIIKKWDPESDIKLFKKNHEPRIISADVDGNTFDLTDPKNAIEAIGRPETRSSSIIKSIAHNYKDDPSGYRYQMGANYISPPNATDLIEKLKQNKYTNMLMPDAYESGFKSHYVFDPEKNVKITNIKKLGGVAPALAMQLNKDISPLTVLGQAVDKYQEIKNSVYSKIAEQLDLTKDKSAKEGMTDLLNFGADPMNLIPGTMGLAVPLLEQALAGRQTRNVP